MVKVEFKAPLVVAPPTYNIVDELKAEGDWEVYKDTVLSLTIMLRCCTY
jgi:aconitase B